MDFDGANICESMRTHRYIHNTITATSKAHESCDHKQVAVIYSLLKFGNLVHRISAHFCPPMSLIILNTMRIVSILNSLFFK